MKKFKRIFLILIIILVCSSCDIDFKNNVNIDEKDEIIELGYGDYISKITNSNINIDEYNKTVCNEINEYYISNYKKGLLEFFNIENRIEIQIDISSEELSKLDKDYYSNNKETYRICNIDIIFNGYKYHYEKVGIRQKGNMSRGNIINDDSSINLRHYKLSLAEKFDDEYREDICTWDDLDALEYRKNRNFYGLDKIDLRWNRNEDSTYLREYYAFEMYRNNGVLAPHSNLTNVKMVIDDKKYNLGVYLAVENINKDFIIKNVSSDYEIGDLYKLGWSNVGATFDSTDMSLFGVEEQIKEGNHYKQVIYPYDLKTNKKSSNHNSIVNFINNIKNTSNDNFYNMLKENTVYSSIISYLSISYLLGDPDDLRGNFNNGYIYFINEKAIFIPIDNDRVLGSTGGTGNPTGHHGALSKPFDFQTGYSYNDKPLFTKSIIGVGNDMIKNDYVSKINEVIDKGWMDILNFKKYYKLASDNYSNMTTLSNKINYSNIEMSLNEQKSLDDSWNLDIETYFKTKKNTFISNISISNSSEYYLRGAMNDWNGITDEYNLNIIDGVPKIEIYLSSNDRFKIATSDWSKEFNFDCLVDNSICDVVGDNRNIKVKESGYYILEIIDYASENPKLLIRKK